MQRNYNFSNNTALKRYFEQGCKSAGLSQYDMISIFILNDTIFADTLKNSQDTTKI